MPLKPARMRSWMIAVAVFCAVPCVVGDALSRCHGTAESQQRGRRRECRSDHAKDVIGCLPGTVWNRCAGQHDQSLPDSAGMQEAGDRGHQRTGPRGNPAFGQQVQFDDRKLPDAAAGGTRHRARSIQSGDCLADVGTATFSSGPGRTDPRRIRPSVHFAVWRSGEVPHDHGRPTREG